MIRIGIDVGGTFTDIIYYDEESGVLLVDKTSTTPSKPVQGIMMGVKKIVQGKMLDRVDVIVHSTTIGTNMFLGQVGIEPPQAVLVTNDGFIDIIEIGRQNRPSLYDLFFEKPKPLIPRDKRIGIKARIGPDGEVLEELDVAALKSAVKAACEKGVRVYVVSFLHSYANPIHEIKSKEIIENICPGSIVVVSSEVDPQPMEYERTSTTIVNALLKPVLSTYLEELEKILRDNGFGGVLLVMQSNGGVARVREALERPAAFIESGPSAGAVAVAYFSKLLNINKALGFDMGGTTAKASSIVDGVPETVDLYEVGGRVHMGRIIRGSGYPVRFPHIDLAEVSAGGGTIAWIDPGGALRVGPLSAGAEPGPACYGKGNREPTITDANLVLGRLPSKLAGGLNLNTELALNAIKEKIANPLGMDVIDAAWTIIGIANTIMARALRLVSVERGHDPREFTLFAFGGSGPIHAVEIADEIGVARVIIPPHAGVFSALGLLVSDYRHSLHAPIVERVDNLDAEKLDKEYANLESKAYQLLRSEGVPQEKIRLLRFAEVKYWGQAYTLRVPYRGSLRGLVSDFEELHKRKYGFISPGEPVEIVTIRVEAIGITNKPVIKVSKSPAPKIKEERNVFFKGGWVKVPVYQRESLGEGDEIEGPSIIEAVDTTIVIPPGYTGKVNDLGAIVVSR